MNTTLPLFSVLIAQYNNAHYLQEAVNSVKTQTYTNWEIIIVDDASTDDSTDLYKLYGNDNRIKIFYNEKNKGCGYTKRLCAELARGEICGFLDPDDALVPDALEMMVNEHQKNKDIALVYSKYVVCDEDLNQKYISPSIGKILEGSEYLHSTTSSISHFATFKKNLYNKTEGINPLLKRAVDKDLYLKMEEVGTLFFIDKPLYLYRIHRNGISLYDNVNKAFFWHMIAIYNTCQRRGLIEEAEGIADRMLGEKFREIECPLKNQIYAPSLKDVFRCIYRYMKNRLFKS